MVVIVFMMEHMHLMYRGAVGYLNDNRQMLKKLDKVPSKSTTYKTSRRMPESYYKKMHFQAIASITAGDMAGDSSDFSIRKFIAWYSTKNTPRISRRCCARCTL